MIRKKISFHARGSGQRVDLENLASFEVSSEDPAHPLENILRDDDTQWQASAEGEQSLRITFDAPQDIARVILRFDEPNFARTQEISLFWIPQGEMVWSELRRQQFNFSPPATTTEREEFQLNLKATHGVEVRIKPNVSGGGRASLTHFAIE